MSLAFNTISFGALIGVAAGAVGALTLEHGWGWVLAQYKARAAKVKTQADSIYAEVTAQVENVVKSVTDDVTVLKADVAALKAKVGA